MGYIQNRRKAFRSFSPSNIPGLQLWLVADNISGNDGDTIETWEDASGNGRTATQSSPTRRPKLQTSELNGRKTLRFDGIDDYSTVAYSLPRPYTIFFVYTVTALTGRMLSSDGVGVLPDNWLLGSHSSGARWWFANGAVGSAGGSTSTWYILTASAASSSSILYSNGSNVANSLSTGVWGSNLNIGGTIAVGGGAPEYGRGDVAEILIYDSVLNSTNQQLIEDYLGSRYNIVITH